MFKPLVVALEKLSVVYRRTCAHTSKQNGMVESRIRLIINIGLTLLVHSNVPMVY